MSINIAVSALGQNFNFSRNDVAGVAAAIQASGPAFADAVGQDDITLTFTRGGVGAALLPQGFGNPEGLKFDVRVHSGSGVFLASEYGITLTELAGLVERRLDEALSIYPTVVATVEVYRETVFPATTTPVTEDEALPEWERELLDSIANETVSADEVDSDEFEPEDEFVLAAGPVRDAIEFAATELGGVTLNDLLDSGVDPIEYGSIVVALRDTL